MVSFLTKPESLARAHKARRQLRNFKEWNANVVHDDLDGGKYVYSLTHGPITVREPYNGSFVASIETEEVRVRCGGFDNPQHAVDGVIDKIAEVDRHYRDVYQQAVNATTVPFTLILRDDSNTHLIVVKARTIEAAIEWALGNTPNSNLVYGFNGDQRPIVRGWDQKVTFDAAANQQGEAVCNQSVGCNSYNDEEGFRDFVNETVGSSPADNY